MVRISGPLTIKRMRSIYNLQSSSRVVSREKIAELRARRVAAKGNESSSDASEKRNTKTSTVKVYSQERLLEFIEGTISLPTWRVALLWYGLVSDLVLSVMDLRWVPSPSLDETLALTASTA